jgi:hypothetical protein
VTGVMHYIAEDLGHLTEDSGGYAWIDEWGFMLGHSLHRLEEWDAYLATLEGDSE